MNISINKAFLIVAGMMIHFQLYAMLPAEKEIIDNMQNPIKPSEGSLATPNDMRSAYLLSVVGWETLRTPEFIEALGEYIENPKGFIGFQTFMQSSSPRHPESIRYNKPDGSAVFERKFYNSSHQYSIREASEKPHIVLIQNETKKCHHVLPKNVIWPKFKTSE